MSTPFKFAFKTTTKNPRNKKGREYEVEVLVEGTYYLNHKGEVMKTMYCIQRIKNLTNTTKIPRGWLSLQNVMDGVRDKMTEEKEG